jgi:hypothetical protein
MAVCSPVCVCVYMSVYLFMEDIPSMTGDWRLCLVLSPYMVNCLWVPFEYSFGYERKKKKVLSGKLWIRYTISVDLIPGL